MSRLGKTVPNRARPFDVDQIDRLDRCMDGELIKEILIKFAIGAVVFIGAGPVFDAPFHVMQAGTFPGRTFLQFVLPGNDF